MTHPQHYRRSIRLKDYDYTQPGGYFITLLAWQRECLFGQIVEGEMRLNPIGKVLEYYWKTLSAHFSVEIDEWVIMPNHFHAVLIIVDDGVRAKQPGKNISAEDIRSSGRFALTEIKRPNGTVPGSLGAIIQNFKSNTTREINRQRQTPGLPVWHRNYYEHILRNDAELAQVRRYIRDNPRRWAEDEENPEPG